MNATHSETTPGRSVSVVVAAAIGMAGGFAALYFSTLPIFLKPLASEFGWGRAQTAAATLAAMLGMALGAVLVGRLLDKLGPAKVIAVSIAAMAAATAALSLQQGSLVLFGLMSFAIGLLGVATTPLGYLSVFPRWFDGRLGLAMGLAMVGLGLGTVSFPIVAQSLMTTWGWRGAYVGLALLALVFGALAWALLFMQKDARSSSHGSSVGFAKDDAAVSEGLTTAEAVRSGRYWLIAGVVFLVSAAGLGSAVHSAAMFTDRDTSVELAAKAVALSGLGVVLGRLITGALLDVMSVGKVGGMTFLLGATGLALVAWAPADSTSLLILGTFLGGLAIGAEGDFIPFVVRRYFGLRAFGAIYGTLFGVYAFGGMVGPVLFGVSFDRLGSYQPAYATAAVLCAIGALATMFLGPYRFSQKPSGH